MPARKIPLNYVNSTGRIQSDKSRGYTRYESALERDCLIRLELDPNVRSFKTQPHTFHFTVDGKPYKYIPDIYVEYNDGSSQIIEVKFRSDLKKHWGKLKPKFKAAIHQLKHDRLWKKDIPTRFNIWTEKEIRTPYLESAKFLLSFKHNSRDIKDEAVLSAELGNKKSSTPFALLNAISTDDEYKSSLLYSLWRLIALGQIGINLNQPITMKSPIWLNDVKAYPQEATP